jgi:hypothetical protein
MTLEEFQKLANIWGGDSGRWPDSTRASAGELARTVRGAAILREAEELDRMLAERPAVSEERARQTARAVVMRLAVQSAQRSSANWERRLIPWLVPASLICSGLAGSALAMMLSPHRNPEHAVLQMVLECGSYAARLTCQ